MGGTVFLDYCFKISYKLAQNAFKKARNYEKAAMRAELAEAAG
jgi:hypothetical protein